MIKEIKKILVHCNRAVFHNIKFITLFWVFNAASAVILSVTIYNVLSSSLSRSLISDELTISFDYFWFIQFRHINELQLEQIPIAIYTVVVIYTVIQTFFLGGLIAVFHQPAKNHTVDFFYGGVKYFNRFIKVTLVSVLLYAIAFKINDYTGDFISWLFKNSESVFWEFVLRSLRYTFLIFLIGVISLLSDYSKVSMAIKDNTEILNGVYSAAVFVKKNFYFVFSVFLIVSTFGALGVVVYNIIDLTIPRTPYYLLVLTFILQQILIIFRLFIRMLFCATEVSLFKDLNADFVKAEAIVH